MASTPPKHHALKSGAWADNEKIAFLVSMLRATTKPNWSQVAIPAGRTMQASQKMWENLSKTAADVVMTEGDAITPSKKRGGGAASNATRVADTGAIKKTNRKAAGAGKKSNGDGPVSNGKGKGSNPGKGRKKAGKSPPVDEEDSNDSNTGFDADDEEHPIVKTERDDNPFEDDADMSIGV